MDNPRVRFAEMAAAVACQVAPQPGRFSHPVYSSASLLAALLLREHLLRFSWLLPRHLRLRIVPNHSALWCFVRRHLTPSSWAPPSPRLFGASAARKSAPRRLHSIQQVSSCSTPYGSFAWRSRKPRGQRGWMTWAFALWVGPPILLSQRLRPGPYGDLSDLKLLATAATAVMPFDQLLANAGYDSEANHRLCREERKADGLIPAKKRRSVQPIATTPLCQEMVRRLGSPGKQADRAAYQQRWKVETVMSVVKRRRGDALTARIEATQRIQALLLGLAYNLQRLVRLQVTP
jgi:hypothetical protein